MRISHRLAGGFVAVVVLATTAACGSSSASKSTSHTTTDPASIAQAEAAVAELSKQIQIDYNPAPLSGSVEGKKIAVVSNQSATGLAAADNIAATAEKLGLKAKKVAVGNSAEEIVDAFDQLAGDKSLQGLIVGGIEPTKWQKAFDTLTGRKVPIVLRTMPDNPAWQTDSVISIESMPTGLGAIPEAVADWITADSEGKGNTVIFTVPGQPRMEAYAGAFQNQMRKICSGCELNHSDIDIASMGKALPGIVVSYLQAHPKVKYAFLLYGDFVYGVPQAIKAAGIEGVKVVSTVANATDVEYIKNGDEAANVTWPQDLTAYVAVDAVARGILTGDMSYAKDWVMPLKLISADTVDDGSLNSDGHLVTPGLEQHFKELWNLS